MEGFLWLFSLKSVLHKSIHGIVYSFIPFSIELVLNSACISSFGILARWFAYLNENKYNSEVLVF